MIAISLFATTLVLLFWRPFGLKIWLISSVAAIFCFVLNLVDLNDIKLVFSIVWDSSLTLIALIILCFSLEHLGFFDFLASEILKLARFKKRKVFSVNPLKFLFLLFVFVFFLASFFANDGAILIFTPIIIAIFSYLKNKNKEQILPIFLLALAFLCDSVSNTFVISNLTNIITAEYLNLRFSSFFLTMFFPNLAIFFSSFFFIWFFSRQKLPKAFIFEINKNTQISKSLALFCILFLLLFMSSFFVGEFFGFRVSFFALFWALLFVSITSILQKGKNLKALKNAPWGVLVFSFGLYIVVFSLYKAGAGKILLNFYTFFSGEFIGIFAVGFGSAFGSAVFNNLPMTMLGNFALSEFFAQNGVQEILSYAHLLGVNIGSKLTPIGSLATLLWLGILANRGIKISLFQYLKFNFFLTLFVLGCGIFVLILL